MVVDTMIYTNVINSLVSKAIDKTIKVINEGYKKMDQYRDFFAAYDDAFAQYKEIYGEDQFYQIFCAESTECRTYIKKLFDQPILTRELGIDIATYIAEYFSDNYTEEIESQSPQFIANLFSNLLCTDAYQQKIVDYRQDFELGKIYKAAYPDILDLCKNSCKECAEEFTETLFLERDTSQGKILKDVYVSPLCKNLGSSTHDPENIYKLISEFIKSDKQILLITANAGMGKSTLMSKLAYDYIQNEHLHGLQKVFFVKLGKLSANTNEPLESIASRLKVNDLQDFNNSLLLLDAYDELQDVNKDVHQFFDTLVKKIPKYHCKVIVTSRLNYLNLSRIEEEKTTTVELLSFNEDLRKRWLDNYGKKMKSYDYLTSTLKKEENDLMGIPIVLYFIAYGDLDVSDCSNKYDLYQNLFGLKAIRKRTYGYETHQPLYENATDLYQLMLDMALHIFQRNTDLIIEKSTVKQLLETSPRQDDLKDTLLKYCGIVSYFNSKGDGIFEYIHKSIYEFFLSIEVYSKVKLIFQTYGNNTNDICTHISNISNLLLYAKLTDQTLEFIFEQMEANKAELSQMASNATDFVYEFLKLGPMTIPQNFSQKDQNSPDFLTQIKNLFFNIWKIYNRLILLTDKNQLADWLYDENKKRLLCEFLRLSRYKGIELKRIHLKGADLSDADLSGADLSGTHLRGAYLRNADLSDADLSGADLSGAHLSDADLSGAHLSGAHLSGAHLSGAHLRGANFIFAVLNNADLSGTHLSFAVLNNVDLSGADLSFAILNNADLSGAHLKAAVLNNVDLRFADLSFAVLNNADLSGADLSGAHLRAAHLGGADLRGTDLSDTHLSGADLKGAHLRAAHLGGADLRGADLKGAHLRGVNLRNLNLVDRVIDVRGRKTKITLTQLSYFIIARADYHDFEIYKNLSDDTLATQDEILSIVDRYQ